MRARRARSRISPERQDDQAFGEVALASASVSASRRLSASAVSIFEVSSSTVAGSSGSRVVAVSESSRCQRTSRAISSTALGLEAHPGRDRAGDRLARDAVLGQAALADVVQQRGDHQDVGTGHVADQRRGLDAGLDDVPVDGEAVDRARRAGAAGSAPTPGSARASAPVSSSVSQTPSSPRPEASSRTSSWRASAGHGDGHRDTFARQAGRGRGRQHDVALGGLGGRAQEQHRILGRTGVSIQDDLAARRGRRRGRSG